MSTRIVLLLLADQTAFTIGFHVLGFLLPVATVKSPYCSYKCKMPWCFGLELFSKFWVPIAAEHRACYCTKSIDHLDEKRIVEYPPISFLFKNPATGSSRSKILQQKLDCLPCVQIHGLDPSLLIPLGCRHYLSRWHKYGRTLPPKHSFSPVWVIGDLY